MKKRSEIRLQDTWRLEDMIESNDAWETLYQTTQQSLDRYETWKGRLAESADCLYRCLSFDDECSMNTEVLYVYARMRSDEDTSDQQYQDMSSRAELLSVKGSEASAYIVPEILEIPEETLAAFRREHAGLKKYGRLLDQILKKRAHTLSREMELLLAASTEATSGASRIFNLFNNADLKFPVITGENGEKIQITHGNYISLLENEDRRIRKEAFEGLYGTYRQFANTLAATFGANVKKAIFYAKARNYRSSRQYYLSTNEIPEEVYDRLIQSVHNNLPAFYRYMELRKRLLQTETLKMYDIYVPLTGGVQRSYSFEEAKEIVLEGLKPLGEEYGRLLREGFENRWIDVYENEGKRSGAYSWGAYGSHPYVLLNFNGTLNDVFTLAHEMGHAIHTWYSNENQPYSYAGYKIFVAEVASTCNEALLIRSLLKKSRSGEERKYLLNHFLESFRGTLYRQTMFAEFEQKAHQMAEAGESLTASGLCGLYRKLNEEYFGPAVEIGEEISYEWARIPHFYTPFYVYQYATGFSAAVAISTRILNGEEGALEGYLSFLKGGCSMEPIELLKLCGVDMSDGGPVDTALKLFGELVEQLEQEFSSQS